MKRALGAILAGTLAFSGNLLADGGSAYTALRTAKKSTNSASLIELKGESGEPRPQEWKLTFSDPTARGGIREVVVSGDVIVSERTPLRGFAGASTQPPVAVSRLNLDSDGAFQIANKQAQKKNLGFNWIDYTLRANQGTGAPMWILRLRDHMGAQVGVMQISAEDGSIIAPLEGTGATVVYEPTHPAQSTAVPMGGVIGTVGNVLNHTANTVKDATLRTVGTVQEVLTGERTIGPKDNGEQ
ncbi:hypothetical protein BH09VER1_BH09VER1_08410 [soil metagenome]